MCRASLDSMEDATNCGPPFNVHCSDSADLDGASKSIASSLKRVPILRPVSFLQGASEVVRTSGPRYLVNMSEEALEGGP